MRSDCSLGTDSDTDVTSSSTSSESDECRHVSKKRGSKRKRRRSVAQEDTTSSGTSSDDSRRHRRSNSSRVSKKKSSHRREREDKERKKDRRKKIRRSEEKSERRHKKREKRSRDKRKKTSVELESPGEKEDTVARFIPKSQFQLANEVHLQQKEIVWRSVEMAKAKLASGELEKRKQEQMEMQRLYGSVDWREKKKLRAEKSRLERTVAAGKKLATIEERESARMDAFRVALGLPTAEAQRQAEWRAEATRALAEAEALNKDCSVSTLNNRVPARAAKVIGPRLP